MKLFALGLTAIALLPCLEAIAKPINEPLNAPPCYMITSKGKLIDLTYMCPQVQVQTQKTTSDSLSLPEITADDICAEFANRWLSATNQFQSDEAKKGLDICKNDRASIQRTADFKLK